MVEEWKLEIILILKSQPIDVGVLYSPRSHSDKQLGNKLATLCYRGIEGLGGLLLLLVIKQIEMQTFAYI